MPIAVFLGLISEKIAAAAAAATAKKIWQYKNVSHIKWGKVNKFQEKNLSRLVAINKKR